MDLRDIRYDDALYNQYIYGSAEVVGLMCLRVFTQGHPALYEAVKDHARSLGAAFQKVNFLRDLKDDYEGRSRTYFPNLDLGLTFDAQAKRMIEADIRRDFEHAYAGIVQLPPGARLGILTAFWYYRNLLKKIARTPAEVLLRKRIRISNAEKIRLLMYAILRNKLRSSTHSYAQLVSRSNGFATPCR